MQVASIFAMVLAGGEGKRLWPLTADRAKPAVPFGGVYRLIDFVLSNLANGGFYRIAVLTQYKSHSLDRHISQMWRLSSQLGHYVASVPAQMRQGPRWFAGSADALYQNLNLLYDERPDYVIVFGADHIYRMDPRQMVEAHIDSGAGVTVAGTRVSLAQAASMGVIEPGPTARIAGFSEKPLDAEGLPDAPDQVMASMGNYVFTTEALIEAVTEDATNENSKHDLGGDIIPAMVKTGDAALYDFTTNVVPGATPRDHAYWRDVGTLDTYYESNMDLISVHPIFNLYNREWPIYSLHVPLPPAKFVFDYDGWRGHAMDSMVSSGAIVSGGTVRRSIICPQVVIEAGALVEDAVLFDSVRVGEGAVVRRCIVDKQVVIPPGARIGVDAAFDRERFTVSENGIVVIGKRQHVPT